MGRILPVILVLLLALSPPAFAASTGSLATVQPPGADHRSAAALQTQTETTRTMLSLRDGVRTESTFVTPSMDIGNTLGMRHDDLQSEFDVRLLEERLASAETDERKATILFQFTYRIEDRIVELRAQDRNARLGYLNGSISAHEYVTRLARIDTESEMLRSLLDRTLARSQRVQGSNLVKRSQTLKSRLTVVEGPIREQVAAVVRGEAPATRIHVAATETGAVLSTMNGSMYVREITRYDHFNATGESNYDRPVQALDRVKVLYPDVANESAKTGANGGYGGHVYSISFQNTNPYGPNRVLTAFLDGSTDEVYKESQEYPVSMVSPSTGVNVTDGDLRLVVNRTYAGGPLRVATFDAETGESANASIAVGETPVGYTGYEDGELWTLAPRESTFNVTATRDGASVNATVATVETRDTNASRTSPTTPEG